MSVTVLVASCVGICEFVEKIIASRFVQPLKTLYPIEVTVDGIITIPSIVEGWSMVLTEAMAYGCVPCAYNSYEAVNEIIENGKSGVVVPFLQWKEMAKSIQSLIDNKKDYPLMANEAHSSIKRYDSKRIAQRWIELANSIKK